MSDAGPAPRQGRTPLEHWWAETNNPLYAWEQMAICLETGTPLPSWVCDYFKVASRKIAELAWGRDFRGGGGRRVEPDEAKRLVGEALGLWKPATKNAFARRIDELEAARAALTAQHGDARGEAHKLQNHRQVTEDRAKRIIASGEAMNKIPW